MESWKREFYATDEGKNYLKHGRTVGSKNGVSTTPGYKAVGELAQGKKPGIGKTITNTAKVNVLKGASNTLNNSRESMFNREAGNGLSTETAEKAMKINEAVDKADSMINDLEKEIGSEKASALKNILSSMKEIADTFGKGPSMVKDTVVSAIENNTKKKDNAYDARKSIYEKELSRLEMRRKALQDEYTRANLLQKRKIQKELNAVAGEIISVQKELGSLNLAYKDGRFKSDGRIVK